MKFYSAFFLSLFLFLGSLQAQKYELDYHWQTECNNKSIKKHFSKTTFKDSISLVNHLRIGKKKALKQGYLDFSVDSIRGFKTQRCIAYIYVGHQYKNINIRYEPKYESILKAINSKYLNPTISLLDFKLENQKIIQYLQNKSFSFASVNLDSISFVNGKASAFLKIDQGTFAQFGKLKIKGSLKLSKSFIRGYTGIKPNSAYEHSKVEELDPNLNKLNFVQIKKSSTIEIDSNLVDINVYADAKKGNRFDGILGILPNDKTTGKMLLTGELNIFVQNLFHNGESMSFNWKKLQSNSQDLDIKTTVPYIASTAFGTNASLNIHKQDSSFLNANSQVSLLYFLEKSNYIGLQYQRKNSSVLSKEISKTSGFESTQTNSYGLVFKTENLNFPQNPIRGYSIKLNASMGNKQAKKDLPDMLQSEGLFKGEIYIPIFRQSTLLLSNQTATLISESIYNNELFRIGGLKTLRGFMESSIYASSYSIFNLEYRFIFEQKSALFIFVNGGWIEKNQEEYFDDYPFGFGLGMFFNTKAGVFSISYAIGKQKNENIQLKNAKIHFGIINQF